MRILILFLIAFSQVYGQDSILAKWQLDYNRDCKDSSLFFLPQKFSKVIGYTFNEDRAGEEPASSIYDKKNKRLIENIDKKTYQLSYSKIDTLLKIINDTINYDWGEAGCFYPHHAFVFYDSSNNIIAYLDVCFTCHMIDTFPYTPRTKHGGMNEIGFNKYFEFCKNLGMTVRKPSDD